MESIFIIITTPRCIILIALAKCDLLIDSLARIFIVFMIVTLLICYSMTRKDKQYLYILLCVEYKRRVCVSC